MKLTREQQQFVIEVTATILDEDLTAKLKHCHYIRQRCLVSRHNLEMAETSLQDAEAALEDAELALYNECKMIFDSAEPFTFH